MNDLYQTFTEMMANLFGKNIIRNCMPDVNETFKMYVTEFYETMASKKSDISWS